MSFQKIGMVWYFDFWSDLLDTTESVPPGTFAVSFFTSPDAPDTAFLTCYFWPSDDIGWVPVYGFAPADAQFGAGAATPGAVLYWRDDGADTSLFYTDEGTGGDRLVLSGTFPVFDTPVWNTPATYQASPADPTGTSGTDVMMGLAGSIDAFVTPRIFLTISGLLSNTGSGNTVGVQMRYGTGTAPTNGAGATGTTAGTKIEPQIATGNRDYPFSLNAIITGLTLNNYWLDLAVSASAGTSTVKDISISAYDF